MRNNLIPTAFYQVAEQIQIHKVEFSKWEAAPIQMHKVEFNKWVEIINKLKMDKREMIYF
jgi:hypothetical protein